jgi:hypothetical protein
VAVAAGVPVVQVVQPEVARRAAPVLQEAGPARLAVLVRADLRSGLSARNRRADAEVTMGDTNMRPHKFKVGELVAFNPAVSRFVPGGVYEVIKHLPGDGEYEYRIKSANELHERVVRESELTKA